MLGKPENKNLKMFNITKISQTRKRSCSTSVTTIFFSIKANIWFEYFMGGVPQKCHNLRYTLE